MADNLPEPESRKEQYLAKAAGMTVEDLPTPASREELYLNAIAEGGGGGGITVVQTTGQSTTDVMSQDATTKMVYPDPSRTTQIGIGNSLTMPTSSSYNAIAIGATPTASAGNSISIGTLSEASGSGAIAIGRGSNARTYSAIAIGNSAQAYKGDYNIAIGDSAQAYNGNHNIAIGSSAGTFSTASTYAVAIGSNAKANGAYTVAIGTGAAANTKGQFDIGTTGANGYNSSAYRLLTGLYDPQNAHDAATKGYVDTQLGGMTLVSISQTDYDNLGTKDPNTLYVITGA